MRSSTFSVCATTSAVKFPVYSSAVVAPLLSRWPLSLKFRFSCAKHALTDLVSVSSEALRHQSTPLVLRADFLGPTARVESKIYMSNAVLCYTVVCTLWLYKVGLGIVTPWLFAVNIQTSHSHIPCHKTAGIRGNRPAVIRRSHGKLTLDPLIARPDRK